MCEHNNFLADVSVGRLSQTDGGPITSYTADIRIRCADCDLPFEFLGLECGFDLQGARVSIDGQEARIALAPKGLKPSPLQRMAFGITKFEGLEPWPITQ